MVHNTEALPLVYAQVLREHTVVWLDGLQPSRRAEVVKQVRNLQNRVVMVLSQRTSNWLDQTRLCKRTFKVVGRFPASAKLMMSANQYDLEPKATTKELVVWANIPARLQEGVLTISTFGMPEAPLLAIHEMEGGRWNSFHRGSQDFQYRSAKGVVAATDCSVIKDSGEGGPCMG